MKKGYLILASAAVAGAVTAVVLFSMKNSRAVDLVYRDVVAEYGTLTAGITKTAPISVGVIEQAFDPDVSTLMERHPEAGELQVEEVLVGVGQQVRKGTTLFRVTSDSVKKVRSALQQEILAANKDCEVLQAKQKELLLQASQGYDNHVIDGKYAGVVYSNACDALQEKANDAKEAVDNTQDQVNDNLLELSQTQQELAEAQQYLRDAQTAVSENYSDRYDKAYYYVVYENTRETAENMVRQLEEQTDRLARNNEALLYEVDEAVRTYHQVLLDLEKQKLAAKLDYDTEIYHSQTASEWYEIQVLSLGDALQDAKARYESALKRIKAFDAAVVRNGVVSAHSGMISGITVEAGDCVGWEDSFAALYDMEAVTIDVTLSEEEYLAVNQEETVTVTLAEHPDQVYAGRIAEVSDAKYAKYDSPAENSYYMATVTVQGDFAEECEGMTGSVTFMTPEKKDVLYVPVRAVFQEGDRFFVKLGRENGSIAEKNVTVGISDGIHVEIVKGLSEGDVVLMAVD